MPLAVTRILDKNGWGLAVTEPERNGQKRV